MRVLLASLAVMCAALRVAALRSAEADSIKTWGGMDFKWQRRVVGFETPHRVGPWAHFNNASGFYAQFTPGVNGDWVYPALRTFDFTPRPFQSNSSSMVGSTFTVPIEWNDRIDSSKEAKFSRTGIPVDFDLDWTKVDLILSGFHLDMACLDVSGGTPCTEAGMSEGIWPYIFDMHIDAAAPGAAPTLGMTLDRAYTPGHGGGKPMTTAMKYTLTFHLQVIPRQPAGQEKFNLSSTAALHDKTVPAATKCFSNEAAGINYVPGVRGFRFELLETDNRPYLGRYFESVKFVMDVSGGNKTCMSAAMQITAPVTTFNSKYVTSIDVMPVQTAAMAPVKTTPHCTVCVSGTPPLGFFSCTDHHMANNSWCSVQW